MSKSTTTSSKGNKSQQYPNKLYYGDNLEILRKYIRDETVDLCYIDPPFNSKRNYNHIYLNQGKEDKAQAQAFVDTWTWDDKAEEGLAEIIGNKSGLFTHQTQHLIQGLKSVLGKGSLLAYLVSMTQRIVEIHRVLKHTGSFYLHCDPTASHYLKLVLDAVFCATGGEFQNEIIWHYRRWTGKAKKFQELHDVIFYYTKSDEYTFNVQYTSYTEGSKSRKEQGVLHRFKKGEEPYLVSDGEVDQKGVRDNDVWQIPFIAPSAKERLGYPTQKPEALMEKIIGASSNKGDLVLDVYCGCGTTVAVAERLGRNWIGMDITYQSISLILKRLEESLGKPSLDKIELNGVPKDIEAARALALKKDDRLRKEFEKWAILTYSNNKAMINEKKGADGGIDGIMNILHNHDQEIRPVTFSVKSGNVKREYISSFNSDSQREGAAFGVFITLESPSKPMKEEANKCGIYENELMGKSFSKVEIVTIQEILDGRRMQIPVALKAVKDAEYKGREKSSQLDFNSEFEK